MSRRYLLVILGLVVGIVTADPLMTLLKSVIIPPGTRLTTFGVDEWAVARLRFWLATGACGAAVAALLVFPRRISLPVRLLVATLPTAIGMALAAYLKRLQMSDALAVSRQLGIPISFLSRTDVISYREVGFDQVPWAGFACSVVVLVLLLPCCGIGGRGSARSKSTRSRLDEKEKS